MLGIALRSIRLLLWSLVVATFVLVVAELAAQLFYAEFRPRTQDIIDTELFHYHPTVVHTVRPNIAVRSDETNSNIYKMFEKTRNFLGEQMDCAEDGYIFKVNEHGFRTPAFSSVGPKAENELRIIIVGGSASISWGVGEACTLDAQLEARLQEIYADKRITLINLGSGAWKSFQELNAIQRYGLALEPDLIIAFNGFNDMSHSDSIDVLHAYSEGHNRAAFRDYYNKAHHPLQYLIDALALPRLFRDLWGGLGAGSAGLAPPANLEPGRRSDADAPALADKPEIGRLATRVTSYPMDLGALRDRTDFSPYAEHVMAVYTRNLELMARTAETIGAEFLVFVQPNLYLRQEPTSEEKERFWKHYAHQANYVVYTHLISLERLQEIARSHPNMHVEDGNTYTMSAPGLVFADYCHMGRYGYALVAEGMAETIARLGLLARPAP